MPLSSVRLADCMTLSSSEFRESDSAVVDEWSGKDTWVPPVVRRLSQVPVASMMTGVLVFLLSLACARLLSLVVRVHASYFPSGPLTLLQLTAFSLCFTVIGLHVTNCVHAWMRCSHETAAAVRAASEVSAYVLLLFVCDRTTLLKRRTTVLDADFFGFLVLGFGVAAVATARKVPVPHAAALAPAVADGPERVRGGVAVAVAVAVAPAATAAASAAAAAATSSSSSSWQPGLLNRHQVEEWCGWQILLFMAYGYFDNVHLYRLVRACMSAFVFLAAVTHYRQFNADLPAQHGGVLLLLRSLWRLNSFVAVTCAVMGDQYMLYYLFAEQSFVAVMVGLLTRAGPAAYRGGRALALKLCVVVAVSCLLWDLPCSPEVFRVVWAPLRWLVRYDNPIVKVEPLHEWWLRTFLDHWIWPVGLVVGHRAHVVDRALRALDSGARYGDAVKVVIAGGAGLLLAGYWIESFRHDVVAYNAYLPYVSWLPILAFVTLRNVFESVRGYYMPLCTLVGSFAMEVYVVQTHMFMATAEANTNQLYSIRLLPGHLPLCDFALLMAAVMWVSYRVRAAAPLLEQFVLPKHTPLVAVLENLAVLALVVSCTYAIHWLSRLVGP
ncbi:10 TM Acyl Transferase domain found in Cas1p [Novymonas esmeraldas]|uniref:10 TM Acyl Transferase domain found in Cas1p n=1 Tax=Novymonas esmeraldas TaxID=1808958 RepID=A0AAW0FAN1_9TRYP